MVNIKIICSCGQKYSFDVYPANGRMPAPVQCPVCGMDGTAAANEIMARSLGAQPQPAVTLSIQPAPLRNRPAPPAPPTNVAPSQPMPDIVKDTWEWCQGLLGGWRDRMPSPTGNAGGKLTATEEIWRQRALEAERRAEQALAAAKNELAPHLAQAIKETLVQELAIQRKELLQAQQIAITELSQLTHHLDELKAPMQERLRSYETRIQELEKDLAARSEENRELLKLKIEMVRHQLEIERTRNRMEFN
jgi:hypothetical protein